MRMAFAPLFGFSFSLPSVLPRKKQHQAPTLAFLALLLAGCTTTPPTGKITDWNSHKQALSAVTTYQATGKLGYISPAQRFSANLNWKTNPGADHLLLTNFLGTTLLKLDTQPGRAVLIDNEGQRHQGSDAAQLVLSLTNIALPVNQMRDWLLGLPTGADTYQLNAQNRVAYLTKQVGDQRWQLDYNDYDETTSPALPARLVLSQGKQRVTLIINRWQTQKN
ncbi:lipoprotein insertase outer membrane protein LolB [Photobacterium sp. TLY01]|uniref:lipoprotein insertase outer membrane protein LolB n=1 Tax=Photobacterium sp. TLY01 TaxID=2907534 RepID=UPI001F1DED78|nr:lipoprotein insertase outer membrane protein LolB [Photobacterium sp. TLY01]UIP28590.1 lipoprotein insertase outer membrane protein LolB [Photobacterium sp. TLY01]